MVVLSDFFRYADTMTITIDTRGKELGPRKFEDAEGFVMPLAAGTGPRRIPLGDYPTGPEVGTHLPDLEAIDQLGKKIDLHKHRDGKPAVLVIYRSAVW